MIPRTYLRRLLRILLYAAVVGILVFYLFPYWWVVSTSFRLTDDERARPWALVPEALHLDNYKGIFLRNDFDVLTGLKNSLIVAEITTVICVLLGSMAGYAYARIPFPMKGLSVGLMLATWTIPWLLILVPLWAILFDVGLVDTKLGLVIGFSSAFLPVSSWILYGHFSSLPEELEDSARIDGCTRLGALFRVILPISTPAIMATGTYAFISSMGEFTFSLMMTTSNESRTLPIVLTALCGKYVTEKTILSAGTVIAAIFPLTLVMIFQRYLIAGLSAGAVKG